MALIWRCADYSQRLRIDPGVLAHLSRYQQTNTTDTESGGQLFGMVTKHEVRLVQATGPYPRDDRGRYRYRSDEGSAQRAIAEQAMAGLRYLGEWHTHAEDLPEPSGDDIAAMTELVRNSRLSTSAVLLLIVGREEPPGGMRILSFGRQRRIDWFCGEAPPRKQHDLARLMKGLGLAGD